MKREVGFTLHKYQDKVFETKKRFIICVSGIRGGKTTIGALWLLSIIQQHREEEVYGDYLICAPTAKILQQSTLPKFREFFPSDWGEWREQKSEFVLKWNRKDSKEPCKIFVRSMDDPEAIEGMEALAAWGDEVGKMKAGSWETITGRLSVTKGPCIVTTTPYAAGWFYRDIFAKGLEHDENYENITWSSIDNPAFPQDEFERKRKELPKALFERRYLGKFTRLEGLVYPEFDEEKHVVEPFDIPSGWLKFAGVDFGFSNPNAIEYIAHDPDTQIFYIYKEFYESEILLKVLADKLKAENFSYILGDTQAAQNMAELKEHYGIRHLKEADKKIEVGIQRIRTLLADNRLRFFRGRTDNTIDEILTYHYPPPNPDKVVADKPVPKKNHAMDALRYAFSRPMHGIYLNRQTQTKKPIIRRKLQMYKPDPYTGY